MMQITELKNQLKNQNTELSLDALAYINHLEEELLTYEHMDIQNIVGYSKNLEKDLNEIMHIDKIVEFGDD